MEVAIQQLPEMIMDVLKAGLVPMLHSSPGMGKSSVARQIAKDNNLKLIDIRLSQSDPTDLNGLISFNEKKTKCTYTPMDIFPLENEEIPQRYRGWLILLDEINSAPLSVQAACYKLILDRQIGQARLHKRVAIIAAGNLSTDRAIVNRLSTAMQSRMIHFNVVNPPEHWIKWAIDNHIDSRIISYINYQPDKLHSFLPDHNDFTFPCHRTWEFLSSIIKNWTNIPSTKLPLIAGTIGEGTAREFHEFCQIYMILPKFEDILKNPMTVTVPEEPSIRFAISGMIGSKLNSTNLEKALEYIYRLPVEFQIITLNMAIKRQKDLINHKEIKQWLVKNSSVLL